jgi:hypothetical protein
MSDSIASRREKQIQFALSRLAERGDNVIERGDNVIERGDNVIERGDNVIERGGGPGGFCSNDVAAEAFRKAASLGGHLVVAFVAPVSASNGRSHFPLGVRRPRSLADTAAAQALVKRLIEQSTRMASDKRSASQPAMRVSAQWSYGVTPRD